MSPGCTQTVEFITIIRKIRDSFIRSHGCLKDHRNSSVLWDYNVKNSVSVRMFVFADTRNKIIRMGGILAGFKVIKWEL